MCIIWVVYIPSVPLSSVLVAGWPKVMRGHTVIFIYYINCIIYCRFNNPNPVGSAREGHVALGVGVQPPLYNGFSKSTQVHSFGPSLNTARALREMDPYVARFVVLFICIILLWASSLLWRPWIYFRSTTKYSQVILIKISYVTNLKLWMDKDRGWLYLPLLWMNHCLLIIQKSNVRYMNHVMFYYCDKR